MPRSTTSADQDAKKSLPTGFQTEIGGVNALRHVVHATGFIYRQNDQPDVGVDGEIEAAYDGRPAGIIFKVQVKAGSSYFEQDDGATFVYRASPKDIEYWRRLTTPILIVLHHPDRDELYAVDFHQYAEANDDLDQRRIIRFDRAANRLTAQTLPALIRRQAPPSVPATDAAPITERILSNFLPVYELPEWLYRAPTTYRTDDDVRAALANAPYKPPRVLWNGELWTFEDLDRAECPLRRCVDTDQISRRDANAWLYTQDGEIRYRKLLYDYLRRACFRQGLRYDYLRRSFYFAKECVAAEDRKVPYKSIKRKSHKTVAKRIATSGGDTLYWRHASVKPEFLRAETIWYLSLKTGWTFTIDGKNELRPAPTGAVARLNRNNYNDRCYRWLIFWRSILFEDRLRVADIRCGAGRLRFGVDFLHTAVNFGIPDDHIDLLRVVDDDDDWDDASDASDGAGTRILGEENEGHE